MMRLIAAEVNRLRARRFTVLAMILVLLALGGFQLIVNGQLTPPSAAAVAANQAAYQESLKDWQDHHEQWQKECRDGGNTETQCAIPAPSEADYGLQPTPFDQVATQALTVSSYLVALAVFMVAGSYIGAEYSSGSLANWLSFIPQRWRVFTSKIITITAFGALMSALAGALMIAVATMLARIHGGDISHLALVVDKGLRGIAIGAILAVLGFCIGLLARHTAGAAGVLLGYLFVWFVRVAVLGGTEWAARLTPWTPEGNLAAIADNGHRYEVPVQTLTPGGLEYSSVELTVTAMHGAVYWVVVVMATVVLALIIFRRRDVN